MGRFSGIGESRSKGSPASAKQLDFIEELNGGDPWPESLTMSEARELIQDLILERDYEEARRRFKPG